jgi:hypothetical protein
VSGFAVALTAAEARPGPAAEFLAGRPGFSLRSAREQLHRGPGFLGRALTLDAAAELRAAAEAAGLSCAFFPEEAVRPPPAPLTPRALLPGPAGFEFFADAGPVFVDYKRVTALCAACWDAPPPAAGAAALKPGLFRRLLEAAGENRLPPQARGPLETWLRADLITADGLRLKLEPESLDFSRLPGRSPSAAANFRALLLALSTGAAAARRNFFLGAFLEGRDLAPLKVAGPDAADLDLVRLLLTAPRARHVV